MKETTLLARWILDNAGEVGEWLRDFSALVTVFVPLELYCLPVEAGHRPNYPLVAAFGILASRVPGFFLLLLLGITAIVIQKLEDRRMANERDGGSQAK